MRDPKQSIATHTAARWQAWHRIIASGALALLMGMAQLTASSAWATPRQASKAPKAPPSVQQPMPQPVSTTVYRCTQANGHVRYTQQPCDADAQVPVMPMQATDNRTSEQVQQGQQVRQREKKLARQLQADRRKFERQGAGQQAASLGPSGDEGHDAKAGRTGSRKKKNRGRHRSDEKADPRASKPLTAKRQAKPDFIARVPGAQGGQEGAGAPSPVAAGAGAD